MEIITITHVTHASFILFLIRTGTIITAAINCLLPLARFRPIFLPSIVESFILLSQNLPDHLSSFQQKNIERTLKNSLVVMSK